MSTFAAVLLALLAYRAIVWIVPLVGRAILGQFIERDRRRSLDRSGGWAGSSSRAWRIAGRLNLGPIR